MIGKMKISEAMPYMQNIAKMYGLRLNHLSEWKLARKILASRYSS